MITRGAARIAIVVILVISTLFLVIPSDAQTDRPVEVWPTETWATSTPEEQGMDSETLEFVYDHVRDSGARIRSLLVVRHGVLVAEEYFIPQLYDVDDVHIVFSVTKSFVSCLVGIAIDQGFIDNTSQLLLDFFPDMTIENRTTWKEAITLEDVLQMRSGLQWDEDDYDGPNDFFAMTSSPNWVQYVLDRPMANEPGSTFYYNSGNSHLLAAIVNVTTGMTPLAFADQYLFGPLGITTRVWLPDPQGINFGGSNLNLRPQDMAKFGLLYLNNGTWDDQQIVSSDWVTRSNNGPSTYYYMTSYGFQWWLDDDDDWYSARGYNGQYIYVVQDHDIVVVFTSDNDDGPYEYDDHVRNIVGAVTNDYPTGTQGPLDIPWLLVGVSSIGIVSIVVFVALLRKR
ncbi:MAG: serine hydrolase domain-containing protein [Candidatus Thorarchaeota archaeon]